MPDRQQSKLSSERIKKLCWELIDENKQKVDKEYVKKHHALLMASKKEFINRHGGLQ